MRPDKLYPWAVEACMAAVRAHKERYGEKPRRIEIDGETHDRYAMEVRGMVDHVISRPHGWHCCNVPLVVVCE